MTDLDQDRIYISKGLSSEELAKINSGSLYGAYLNRLNQFADVEHGKPVIKVPTNKGGGVLPLHIFNGIVEPLVDSGKIVFEPVDIDANMEAESNYCIRPRYDPQEKIIRVEIDNKYRTSIGSERENIIIRGRLPEASGEIYKLWQEHIEE